ncbi:hypothetical protein [Nostoc sp. FACHB-110]|uniref:hypothetical protein n=1 Tax=Nostoc sp. FACHB-110 TaxID=2692834 RepID=UPI001687EE35|nr:hypothetical protein [Nostoc sp. FACHB-110]MBD2440806.1 hypothetical protein [Nostoc sp. FACHB-110]
MAEDRIWELVEALNSFDEIDRLTNNIIRTVKKVSQLTPGNSKRKNADLNCIG